MKEAIIVGAGTYGEVYAAYLSKSYNIIGFIDDDDSLIGKEVLDIPILGNFTYLESKVDRSINVFVPIGNNIIRTNILKKLEQLGFKTPSFIHESASIHETVILESPIYILSGVNIMPFTSIEKYTMISMGVNIAHHTKIDIGCFFSQGTNIGASIRIEERAYFGIASTAMTGVKKIGTDVLIGAGAVVINDIPNHAVVAGVPAKILRYSNQ